MFAVWNRLSIHHATFVPHYPDPMGKVTLLSHFTHEETELERHYVPSLWS